MSVVTSKQTQSLVWSQRAVCTVLFLMAELYRCPSAVDDVHEGRNCTCRFCSAICWSCTIYCLYSSVSSCTNVRVLLVCVKGLIVRAQYSALPSVGVVQFIVCTVASQVVQTSECCWCALRALLYVPSMLYHPCAWLCDLDICLLILILL